ncbi:MAG: PAS domain S-box protein [Verrucomicrobiota bacterium]
MKSEGPRRTSTRPKPRASRRAARAAAHRDPLPLPWPLAESLRRLPGRKLNPTDGRRAFQALLDREEVYRKLFEAESDAIFLVDRKTGRFLDANLSAERLYGYNRRELLQLKAVDVSAEPTRTSEAIRKGKTRAVFRWHRRKDGSRFPVEVSGSYLKCRGRSIHVAAIRDISGRLNAEQALQESDRRQRSIAEITPNGILLFDKTGLITFANAAAERILGLRRRQIIGRGYADPAWKFFTVEGGSFRFWELPFEKVLRSRKPLSGMEFSLERPGGKRIILYSNAAPLWDASRKPAGMVAAFSDITERKLQQQQLATSREHLRALAVRLNTVREEERTRIARTIHDDLGHALTDLKLDLAWLSRRLAEAKSPKLDPVRHRVAAMIGRVDRHAQTVRRIATELRPAVLDALGLPAAIEWQTRAFQERTQIPCRTHLPRQLPAPAPPIVTGLFRIFEEILSNIARHARATRVDVRLHTARRQLVLQVNDNGRGITPAQESDPKALGLLGMRERATTLGGWLTLRATPGRGTCVRITLPLDPP